MNCPKCGKSGQVVVKCNKCGDVRCNSAESGKTGGCNTQAGPFGKSGLGGKNGATCHACKKGKYEKI